MNMVADKVIQKARRRPSEVVAAEDAAVRAARRRPAQATRSCALRSRTGGRPIANRCSSADDPVNTTPYPRAAALALAATLLLPSAAAANLPLRPPELPRQGSDPWNDSKVINENAAVEWLGRNDGLPRRSRELHAVGATSFQPAARRSLQHALRRGCVVAFAPAQNTVAGRRRRRPLRRTEAIFPKDRSGVLPFTDLLMRPFAVISRG
jgi:hypothetical protein